MRMRLQGGIGKEALTRRRQTGGGIDNKEALARRGQQGGVCKGGCQKVGGVGNKASVRRGWRGGICKEGASAKRNNKEALEKRGQQECIGNKDVSAMRRR